MSESGNGRGLSLCHLRTGRSTVIDGHRTISTRSNSKRKGNHNLKSNFNFKVIHSHRSRDRFKDRFKGTRGKGDHTRLCLSPILKTNVLRGSACLTPT